MGASISTISADTSISAISADSINSANCGPDTPSSLLSPDTLDELPSVAFHDEFQDPESFATFDKFEEIDLFVNQVPEGNYSSPKEKILNFRPIVFMPTYGLAKAYGCILNVLKFFIRQILFILNKIFKIAQTTTSEMKQNRMRSRSFSPHHYYPRLDG